MIGIRTGFRDGFSPHPRLKAILACLILLAFPAMPRAATVANWDFTQGLQGWTGNASVGAFATTDEGMAFDTVAADPYLTSPAVTYPTDLPIVVTVRMRSNADPGAELFYGATFRAGQSRRFTVTTDGAWHEYTFWLPPLGKNARLRLDPCEATGHITIAWIRAESIPRYLELNNGVLLVKLDLTTGGPIAYLSTASSTRNLVNIADRGRYIQQSYYAGNPIDRKAEGQASGWSPWPWNPIQVGDAFMNPSAVLDARNQGGEIYVKNRPLLWDMNLEWGECDFETWVTLRGNTVHVRNKLTCFRTDNRWPAVARHQELPAVYTIGDLSNLYTYKGNQPFTSAPLTRIENINATVPKWEYWQTPEHWAAHVDNAGWGVGVYNARSTQFVGGYFGQLGGGATSGNTGYISPLRTETLTRNSVYEYQYDLIVGTLAEIRQFVYHTELNQARPAWSKLP